MSKLSFITLGWCSLSSWLHYSVFVGDWGMAESTLSKSQSRQDRSNAGIVRGNIQGLWQESYEPFWLRGVVLFQAVAATADKGWKPTPLWFSECRPYMSTLTSCVLCGTVCQIYPGIASGDELHGLKARECHSGELRTRSVLAVPGTLAWRGAWCWPFTWTWPVAYAWGSCPGVICKSPSPLTPAQTWRACFSSLSLQELSKEWILGF